MSFREIVKSSGTTLVTTVAVTVISFLTSVLTTRLLGPEGRGLLSGALLIVTLSCSIASCGLANSYIYHRGAGRLFNYKKYIFASALFVAGLASGLSLIGLFFNQEAQLHHQMLLIVIFTLVSSVQAFFMNLSQLQAKLSFLNVLRLLAVVLNLVALLVVKYTFPSIDFINLLYAQFVCMVIQMAVAMRWAKKNVFTPVIAEQPRVAGSRSLLQFAFNQHGAVLLGLALTNFDKIYLLRAATIVEFGYYSLAFTTSRLIGVFYDAMNTALYSRYAGKDEGELSKHINTAFRMTLLPMLLLAGLGAVLAPWLVPTVYGPKFSAMTPTFIVLMFECVISGACWTLSQRFEAAGRPGLVLVRQLISVLPVVALLPFLPKENISIYLALMMLMGAALRAGITLAIYPWVLKEPMPRFLPSRDDIGKVLASIRNVLRKWRKNRQLQDNLP
ncbi:MAG: hypothetical protein JWP38_807 [Herbaspirillum sp.]|nr:hypothetical protein [Herbaspirillum sp.]